MGDDITRFDEHGFGNVLIVRPGVDGGLWVGIELDPVFVADDPDESTVLVGVNLDDAQVEKLRQLTDPTPVAAPPLTGDDAEMADAVAVLRRVLETHGEHMHAAADPDTPQATVEYLYNRIDDVFMEAWAWLEKHDKAAALTAGADVEGEQG